MVSIRSAASALLLLAVSLTLGTRPVAAAPIVATTLSGIVRDDTGGALEGAEVLILPPEGRGDGALLRAVSDAGGRFIVGAINPGVYRIAAIKSGYIASLGRVNTLLRSSVDLVLRPVPKVGQPGAEKVLNDLSWTLRVPPRSILRELEARDVLAPRDTGGVRAVAARIDDSVRGEVDHLFAVGSWRPGSSGPSSNLEGNETRMRFAGALGQRGAIQVHGRHGSLDSSSSTPSSSATVSRGTSDVDLDLSYDTSVDETLAMRAFYSSGDLEMSDVAGVGGAARQGQRSWGYDAKWRKQVDPSSNVALKVGFHDANLDLGRGTAVGWDPAQGDASNRAIGAEGSYENFVGDGHLVRVGVRAQLLSLSVPSARLGRANGAFLLDGTTGWSLLVDSADRWSVAGPVAVTYGVAVRQGFDGPGATTVSPRVGGTWTAGRMEARGEVSYVVRTREDGPTADPLFDQRSPYGYDVELKARVNPTLTLRGTATYLPSRANVWGSQDIASELETLYVTDGLASDRFVAVDLERVASSATVSFRVARGRAEGALAPALDDVPVVLLSDRALDYDAARLGVRAPRSGSLVSLEYRAIRERPAEPGLLEVDALRTVGLEFAQELVRFAGDRASCRFLLTARTALGHGPMTAPSDSADARRFVAEHKRIGAGVSLAF